MPVLAAVLLRGLTLCHCLVLPPSGHVEPPLPRSNPSMANLLTGSWCFTLPRQDFIDEVCSTRIWQLCSNVLAIFLCTTNDGMCRRVFYISLVAYFHMVAYVGHIKYLPVYGSPCLGVSVETAISIIADVPTWCLASIIRRRQQRLYRVGLSLVGACGWTPPLWS